MTEITAKQAKEAAETIMNGDGSRRWAQKMAEYIGDWNTLSLYLEAQVRAESK